MRIDVVTLFPEIILPYLGESILQRAQDAGILTVKTHNIRDYTTDKHRITDEPPYGGGGGMILKPQPIFRAVEAIHAELHTPTLPPSPVILMTPQGRLFSHQVALELSQYDQLIVLCGRYEGVDERVREHLVTDELSIGDYVLTGGELGALVVIDALTRLLPGALGADGAADADSHAHGLLEGPHYTRPETFRDQSVPPILLSGHAAQITRWRREQALRRTWQRRPEMLLTADLSEEDRRFLAILAREQAG